MFAAHRQYSRQAVRNSCPNVFSVAGKRQQCFYSELKLYIFKCGAIWQSCSLTQCVQANNHSDATLCKRHCKS